MRRAIAVAAVLSLGAITRVPAQDGAKCATQPESTVIRQTPPLSRPAPFAVGEALRYAISFGKVHVGSGNMLLVGRDTVRGRETWRAVFTMSAGFWPVTVRDSMESWFEPLSFTSLRFIQELREPRYRASKYFDIFPERHAFQIRGKPEMPSVADPMDDVSFVYFARALPLEPGQCYELARYFRPDGNPVVIRVVRRDTISVPAGRFPTIVIQPELTTSAIFSKNGRAELWLSDDSARVVVQLKTQLSFGSINLYLSRIDTVLPPLKAPSPLPLRH
jgi:hypothetical protein